MTEKNLRRRIRVTNSRKSKPPNPSPSPHRRTPSSSRKPSDLRVLKRCFSEPMLWSDSHDQTLDSPSSGATLFRPRTYNNVFASSPSLFPSSPQSFESYNKEAKVVVNVTVEGSPGPIRTMVKLGSTVEDTIKLVVDKYNQERRTPKFDPGCTKSSFELHHSYFSLQSLDKSESIGDVGSRNFYLRKSSSVNGSNGGLCSCTHGSDVSVAGREMSAPSISPPPFILLHSLIARAIGKIVRRAGRFCKIITCSQ